MIQITPTRALLDATEHEIEGMTATFARRHVVRLPGFFDRRLLGLIGARLTPERFRLRIEHDVEIEQTLDDPGTIGLSFLALNDPGLFRLVQRVTGCGVIGSFLGRIYRRAASTGVGHYYPWHNDVARDRIVGVSVNLSERPYHGGVLQIRDATSKALLSEEAITAPGDALLFRISKAVEHQVTPVEGDQPRTVLAGWFRSHPDYRDWLLQRDLAGEGGTPDDTGLRAAASVGSGSDPGPA